MQQEQLVQAITKLVVDQLKTSGGTECEERIPIGISARHVHLTQEHVDELFGKGYQLTKKKELMGGQFASNELVTLVGTKLRAIENVRILGPCRKASRKIEGSAPIALVGPKGVVYLNEGWIVAKRHIHMSTDDAKRFGVTNGQSVKVRFDTEKGGIMEDVIIRVDPTFTLEMHIDTDEANGLGVGKDMGILIK